MQGSEQILNSEPQSYSILNKAYVAANRLSHDSVEDGPVKTIFIEFKVLAVAAAVAAGP